MDEGSGAGSIVGPSVSVHHHRRSPFPLRKRLNSENSKSVHNGAEGGGGKRKKKLQRSISDGNMRSAIAAIVSINVNVIGDIDALNSRQKRYRSADSLQYCSSRFSDSDGHGSRSCSPAPSSGIDCPPMQLDHDTMSESGMSNDHAAMSVMSGGCVKGWLPDVAVVLWRRMLGALGNINHIADTVIHAQIYKYLIELFEIMVRIRNNQVSVTVV
jgi:hypothetical protein